MFIDEDRQKNRTALLQGGDDDPPPYPWELYTPQRLAMKFEAVAVSNDEDAGLSDEDLAERQRVFEQIMDLVDHELTAKQRDAVLLHVVMGIGATAASRLLETTRTGVIIAVHGSYRPDGSMKGGALKKLRRLCEERGIRPPGVAAASV